MCCANWSHSGRCPMRLHKAEKVHSARPCDQRYLSVPMVLPASSKILLMPPNRRSTPRERGAALRTGPGHFVPGGQRFGAVLPLFSPSCLVIAYKHIVRQDFPREPRPVHGRFPSAPRDRRRAGRRPPTSGLSAGMRAAPPCPRFAVINRPERSAFAAAVARSSRRGDPARRTVGGNRTRTATRDISPRRS